MSSVYVIKKKPLFYKLGAKVFKYLRECNKIVEYEKFGKVLETYKKHPGLDYAFVSIDELNELNKEDTNGSKE